jgi:precorrin-3B C17-methyltransferase
MTGKLTVVGIGPGHYLDRTIRAEIALQEAEVVVGYHLYVKNVEDLIKNKIVISSGMKKEIERCHAALHAASLGHKVALISSGDAGIYGMAGLALEMAQAEGLNVAIEIIPGVSAASATAAVFGAPLMLDWACISLSDLLIDWSIISRRITAIAEADLVVALYNPKSNYRKKPLEEAVKILLRHRPASTPVGIGTAIGTTKQKVVISTLDQLCNEDINMRSLIIVGNTTSRIDGNWFITPRGYQL